MVTFSGNSCLGVPSGPEEHPARHAARNNIIRRDINIYDALDGGLDLAVSPARLYFIV